MYDILFFSLSFFLNFKIFKCPFSNQEKKEIKFYKKGVGGSKKEKSKYLGELE